MAALEILEHLGQLATGRSGLQAQHAIDDMIGSRLVGRIEITGLGRRLERSDDDSGRVGAKMKRLTVQELGLKQVDPLV